MRESTSQATLPYTPSAGSGSDVNALSASSLTVIVPAHPHFSWLACEIPQENHATESPPYRVLTSELQQRGFSM